MKDEEWKTTFYTYYDHFKYVVMPFNLTNVLMVFQHLMDNFFVKYLNDFVVCYINDIFIFPKNLEEHEWHVCLVLDKLRKVGLRAKLEKCEFYQAKVEFLNYIIFGYGVHMDPCKV
jgi:hypothetical protein